MGKLIQKHKNMLEIVYSPYKRMELTFYRNQLLHIFFSEALIATALYTLSQKKNNSDSNTDSFYIPRTQFIEEVKFASKMIKYEVIYKPSSEFDSTVATVLEFMKKHNIIMFREVNGQIDVTSIKKIDILPPESKSTLHFLASFIWPFIESYWLTCMSLFALLQGPMMEEKTFLKRLQMFARTLQLEGELRYEESMSSDVLKNALLLYEDWGVISLTSIEASSVIKVIQLRPDYTNDKQKLTELVEKVGSLRATNIAVAPSNAKALKIANMHFSAKL